MKSVPTVAFDYHPSRILIGALAIGATLALASLFMSGISLIARLLIGTIAVICFSVSIVRSHRHAPVRAAWQSAGHWRLIDAQGKEHDAELRDATVRGEWIVLNLRRTDRKPVHLVMLPDNSSPDVRRQLRVRLSRGTSPARA